MLEDELDLLSNYVGRVEDCDADTLEELLARRSTLDRSQLLRLVRYGARCLGVFVQLNFVGPSQFDESDVGFELPREYNDAEAADGLALNGEPAYALCRSPAYFYLAILVFVDSARKENWRRTLPSISWWTCRACWIWQQLFVDRRAELRDIQFEEFKYLDDSIASKKLPDDLKASYALEKSRALGFYFESEKAETALNDALTLVGLNSVQLTGVLGRRTKFQTQDVAQLALLESENDADEEKRELPTRMEYPSDCALNDDTLLEKTQFQKAIYRRPFSSMQECALLAFLENLRRTHSADEETALKEIETAYLDRLLYHPVTYVCKYVALIRRSRLEANDRRRIERALAQAEQLAKEFETPRKDLPTLERFRFALTVGVPPIWDVRKLETTLLIRLGCTSEALRIFLDLQLWDEAVDCYRKLGVLDRAEAIVREQLELKETPHLWCLLGDVVNEASCYEKAWALSGNRLARAQSSLGFLYFGRKKFREAVDAFETALAILPLDLKSWYCLGYCAMQTKNYDSSARAYRRCTIIDSDNFEAWNNLAACYVYSGDKARAFQVLAESVKCNYENWKVWENYVVIGVDTGHLREALTGINRLIDLKGKFDDAPILEILVRAATDQSQQLDLDEHFLKDTRSLFGRITSKVINAPSIWRLYSDLCRPGEQSDVGDWEKYVNLLQKAHQTAARSTSWWKDEKEAGGVSDYACLLAEAQLKLADSLTPSERAEQLKASTRLMIKGVLSNLASADDQLREKLADRFFKMTELLERVERS